MKAARRILVVDDDVDFCEEIKVCLLDLGYEFVLTANSADEAVKIASKENPDIILLDIVMPGMDGDILAEKLQEKEETKNVPIIFVTGIINAEEAKIYRKKPNILHRNFISKPIDPEELRDQINNILENNS